MRRLLARFGLPVRVDRWLPPLEAPAQPFDREAGAYCPLHDTVVALHPGGALTHYERRVIEVRDAARLPDYRRLYLELVGGREILSRARAVVHGADGAVRRGEVRSVGDRVDLLADGSWGIIFSYELVFPVVQAGDRLELNTLRSQLRPADPALPYTCHEEHLQLGEEPTGIRRLTVAVRGGAAVHAHNMPADAASQPSARRGYDLHSWTLRAIPPWIPQADGRPVTDRGAWVDASTYPDWETVAAALRPAVLREPDDPAELARFTAWIAGTRGGAGAETVGGLPADAANACHRFCGREVAQTTERGLGLADVVRAPDVVVRERVGDARDRANLLRVMLGALGHRAELAFVRRAQGRTPLLPSLRLDHVLVRSEVAGAVRWFDPAALAQAREGEGIGASDDAGGRDLTGRFALVLPARGAPRETVVGR